ncbi:MAG: PaaI family thioesterase [Candidatus Aminicenantes bacterium]|nr:PaaI family thioesterase [Candidatus Aminicenantes bacterium]
MNDFSDDQNCFVCGKKNAAGLQLEFARNPGNGQTEARVAFPVQFQGWRSTVHGGLLATVLDETMIQAAGAEGVKCVTAEITVKYRKPAMTNEPCLASARILETRGRIVFAEGRICDGSGQVLAQATGKLFKIKEAEQS